VHWRDGRLRGATWGSGVLSILIGLPRVEGKGISWMCILTVMLTTGVDALIMLVSLERGSAVTCHVPGHNSISMCGAVGDHHCIPTQRFQHS
jgi:hypothetical protein